MKLGADGVLLGYKVSMSCMHLVLFRAVFFCFRAACKAILFYFLTLLYEMACYSENMVLALNLNQGP